MADPAIDSVQNQLPDWDTAAAQEEQGQQEKLPSWDDLAAKEDQSPLSAAASYYGKTINPYNNFTKQGRQELTQAQQQYFQSKPAFSGIMEAFGQSFSRMGKAEMDAYGDTVDAFAKDMAESENNIHKGFIDGVVVPSVRRLVDIGVAPIASAGSALMAGAGSLIEGADQVVGSVTQGFDPSGDLLPSSMMEAFGGDFGLFHTPKPPLPREVAVAKANRILESEQEFFGLKEPTPEQQPAINEAAAMYPDEVGAPVREPEPDIHQIARSLNPEVFNQYDALSKEKDFYRGVIKTFADARDAEAESVAPHTAEIKELQARLEDASARNAKRYQSQIDDLTTKNQEWIDQYKARDTEDMAKTREALMKTDYQMRDIAHTGEIAKAYREAETRMPKPQTEPLAELPEEAPEPAPAASEPEAAPTILGPKFSIADSVKDSLVKAGRPEVEAQALGELESARYETLAKQYPKFSAQEWYEREAAEIKAGGNRAKVKGKLSLAQDGTADSITIFSKADASTVIHEKGHEWTEQLIRLAREDDAPAQMKTDAETLKKWAGFSDKVAETTAEKAALTKAREKFARGFERYLMEGTAPSKELARVFAQFKQWLTAIYETVNKLKAPITDDVRDVFDRLLANAPERAIVAPELAPIEEAGAVTKEAGAVDPLPVNPGDVKTQTTSEASAEKTPAPVKTESDKIVEESKKQETINPSASEKISVQDDLVDKAGNIRLEKLTHNEDVREALRQAADTTNDFESARNGPISDADVTALADSMGIGAKELNIEKLREISVNDGVPLAVRIKAGRKMLVESSQSALDAMAKAKRSLREANKTGADSDRIVAEQDKLAALEARNRHLMIAETISSVTEEWGRAGRAFRDISKEEMNSAQAVTELFQKLTNMSESSIDEMINRGANLETPQQVSKFMQDSTKPKFKDMALEFWINALLSGPVTHVKNILGNMATAVHSITETAGAAAVGAARDAITGEKNTDRVYLGEAKARMFGLMQGAQDGMKAAKSILKDEDAISGPHTVEQAQVRAIPGIAGQVIRLPSRFLSAEDEVFKSIAYRQELNAIAFRTASKEGLAGDAFNQRMADIISDPSEDVMEAAQAHSEYQTYTKKLGATGAALQKFANSHPLAKIVIPFIRTPTNILKYAGERTPFAVLSKEVQANLRGDHGRVAQDTQIARIAIGTAIGVATLTAAVSGAITGGGPSDSKAKAMLRATGWQPYSIKVGGTYYSYAWMEPFSTIMGISADMHDISAAATDEENSQIAGMLFSSIAKNLMSKLSLRGASDLINALADPDRYGDSYIENLAGTAVPSFIAQIARSSDPTMRGVGKHMDEKSWIKREMMRVGDAVEARVPGFRDKLLPVRDTWGEPIVREGNLGPDFISPIYETREKNDPVASTMVKLNISPSKLDNKIRGVPLSDQQYDDYSRIAGKMTKLRLNGLVNNQSFQAAPDAIKVKAINKIIETTRENTRKAIMMKYPVIIQQAIANKRRELGKS